MQGGVDHNGLPFLELHLHLRREVGASMDVIRATGLLRCVKRACTVLPEADALPPSSLPLQPISAAERLSSLSKRWPCEVKVGEWPRLVASE